MGAQLLGLNGALAGKTFPLGSTPLLVGREPACPIPVIDSRVSRRHAQVSLSSLGAVIEDLGSQNGTFVNDFRIQGPTTLQTGDTIRVADQLLRFETTADIATASGPTREVSSQEKAHKRGSEVGGSYLGGGSGNLDGCAMPDLDFSGCMQWLIRILILLLIAIVLGLIIMGLVALVGSIGGLGASGAGAAGGGAGASDTAPASGTGATGPAGAPDTGAERKKPGPSQQVGGTITILSVRVAFVHRSGFEQLIPVALVTWRNDGQEAVNQVTADVVGLDSQEHEVIRLKSNVIYKGVAVAPQGVHEDTEQEGGVPLVDPATKLPHPVPTVKVLPPTQ